MNDGAGPDLLGVCEVENRFVLELLAAAVHPLLPARLRDRARRHRRRPRHRRRVPLRRHPADRAARGDLLPRRDAPNATREIVQVNFRTSGGHTWAVFGNHWPSRSGGRWESAGYRDIAGETLGYWHDRVLEVHGPDTPVLAMGDFNDEPFDTSLVTHAGTTRQPTRWSTPAPRCCGT